MPPVGFEPTISAGKRSQTHALDRAVGHWDRGIEMYLHVILTLKLDGGCHQSRTPVI